jgi:hypothetical protein
MHYYSSKPVLWPTMLAGQYWLIQKMTGWTFERDLFLVVRLMLIINNVLGLALLVWCLGRISEQVTNNVASRGFVVVCGAVGTYLTSFSVTLNNHLPAAVLVALSLLVLLKVMRTEARWWVFFVLGLLASLAATMELPAAGWLAICAVIALSRSLGKTLTGFAPAAILVAASFFGVNFLAHGDWRPPYAHRSDGPVIARVTGDFADQLDQGQVPRELLEAIDRPEMVLEDIYGTATVSKRTGAMIPSSSPQWIIETNGYRLRQFVVERGTNESAFIVRELDNWYDYPGSYWRTDNLRKSKIDEGEPDKAKYLVHMTVGHHGVLSLTPIFLLSLLGIFPLCFNSRYGIKFLSLATLGLTVVVFAFYVMREHERNYGGMTSGLRWMFWLYPIWLIWMIPPLELASRRKILWLFAILLLAFSVASAQYSAANPWVHPWLYEWMLANGYVV